MANGCNHAECNTPYCPMCGAGIKAGPLDMLMRNLRNNQKRYIDEVSGWTSQLAEGSRDKTRDAFRNNMLARSRALAGKWGGWADAVEALIEKAGGTDG